MKRTLIAGIVSFVLMGVLPFLSARENVFSVPVQTETAEESPVPAEKSQEQPSASSEASQTQPSASSETSQTQPSASSETSQEQPPNLRRRQEETDGSFRILDTSTGEVATVSDREFCYGAVAYEMPPSYEKEALKAQCTACYTHFSRLRKQQRENPDSSLKGADFAADLSQHQYYFSEEALKEKWGSLYEKSSQALHEAVDECFGERLYDTDGTFIDVAYFALSAGVTEDAKNIFGFESPYLRPAASPFDKTSPSYRSEVTLSSEEFTKALCAEDGNFSLGEPSEQRIGTAERTKSGTVLSVRIGNRTFTGNQLRELLGLRSANFTIADKGDSLTLTVLGYGHGVGMSQYGANEMAKQGADYQEILSHYYHIVC